MLLVIYVVVQSIITQVQRDAELNKPQGKVNRPQAQNENVAVSYCISNSYLLNGED